MDKFKDSIRGIYWKTPFERFVRNMEDPEELWLCGENCPYPHTIEFADIFAVQYVVGTTAVYTCDPGYKRKKGAITSLKCKNHSGYAQWQTEPHMCIVDPSLPRLPSIQPATEKWEGTSAQPVMKDVCGSPRPPNRATLKELKYYVGQKLNYVCRDGYQAQTPISEVSTCEILNRATFWSDLILSCTNVSSIAEEATTQLLPAVSVRTEESDVRDQSNHPVPASGWFHVPVVAVLLFPTIATIIIL